MFAFYDWVPDWAIEIGGFKINIVWCILIGFAFGVAAVYTYSPCTIGNIPVIGPFIIWEMNLGGRNLSC